jgi:hypothetical protein
MKSSVRSQRFLGTSCCVVLLLLAAPFSAARSQEKIPREVIDEAAAHGTVMVLVGLKVPWEMESRLSDDELRSQRTAIASIQSNLLTTLQGRNYKLLRRYEEVPGIALEVGADALAELARLPIVTNVLLDRSPLSLAITRDDNRAWGESTAKHTEGAVTEKVPFQLFKRAATDGTVLVLAGLRTPWQREDQLSDVLLALQRTAIYDAQGYILAELAGTRFKVMRLYQSIPGIALRVGVDALRILERSPAVTNVVPDRPPVTSSK